MKSNAKAVITSTVIAPTALAATRACLSSKTPFIVIDDNSGPIPEDSILFDVSITKPTKSLD